MSGEIFITYFDINYLPQGLSLYKSLNSHDLNFKLFVLCLDQTTYKILKKQNNKNLELLKLKDFENDKLKQKKRNRTKAEYCWTLTSWSIQWCLEINPEVNRVTYLDADLYFFKNPKKIFYELDQSRKKILITKHAFSPEYDQSFTSGIYCVQFLTISRGVGEIVLKTWRDQCMEWCFNRHEDEKFGDQKYLDLWPEKYKDIVHVLKIESLAQGPWNAQRFPYSDAVFFHFHGFKIFSKNRFLLSTYLIPRPTYQYIYKPYIKIIKNSLSELSNYDYKVKNSNFIIKFFPFSYSILIKLRNVFRKYFIPNIHID